VSSGRRRAAATVALLGLALAGCAGLPAAAPGLSGRLSLQVSATPDAPARGFQAGFDLRGNAAAGSLHLSTPLGPQIAVAQWAAGQVLLQSRDGERRFASLAALSLELLGEDLPLQALPDWLRGLPWPGASHRPVDDGFEQLGWRLDLSRQDQGFIVATRPAPPVVSLRVRLDPGT
jgi:outer membrane lipoprotein LolB